jgi:DNA-binding LytR/AlgR family response regulator
VIIIFLGAIPLTFMIEFTIQLAAPVAPDLPYSTRYLQVLGIGLIANLLMAQFFSAPVPAGEATGAPNAVRLRPRLFNRLPLSFGERLYCLSSEDHYVRAHGEHGSVLLLMRMKDAIAELDGLHGLRVHRSWWVARDAVERVERNGRMRIVLANGMSAPVARSCEGAVRSFFPLHLTSTAPREGV